MCVCVCVCTHARENEKPIVAEYVSARWLNACVCAQYEMLNPMKSWVDRKMPSILILFQLRTCFRWLWLFPCSAVVLLKLCTTERAENFWEIQKYARRCCFRQREIDRFPNHVTGSKRKVYFCAGQIHLLLKCVHIVENTGAWLFSPMWLPKQLILFWHLIIFVSGTSFLQVRFWSYFSRIFHSMCYSLICKKYRSVNIWNHLTVCRWIVLNRIISVR